MTSFQELALPESLQAALTAISFNKPTEIQAKVIPTALDGQDIVACAETGSGKTAAYGIPIVAALTANPQSTALVLAPTRELAQQIADFLRNLTINVKGLQVVSLVGGADIRKQLNNLKRNPRIVVATPGRLTDHLKRRSVSLSKATVVVLDEGDRMLDMGFAPQLDVIYKYLPQTRQTMLFTATLGPRVERLAKTYLKQPKSISAERASLPVASIKQSVMRVSPQEKNEKLLDELNSREGLVIIFHRTQVGTDKMAKFLKGYGFTVETIHGGRTQGQRNMAIANFKQGKMRILCATDVAARGLDVPEVQHVINFDLPMVEEDYVHRIGRTARNGASGEALSFVTPNEVRTWQGLVRRYKLVGLDVAPQSSEKRSGGRGNRSFASRSESRPQVERGPFQKKRPFRANADEDSSPRLERRNREDSPRRSQEDRPFRAKKEGGYGESRERRQEDRPYRAKKEGGYGESRERRQEDRPYRAKKEGGYGEPRERRQEDRPKRREWGSRDTQGERSENKSTEKKRFAKRSGGASSFFGKKKTSTKRYSEQKSFR